jgi:hypothetical protein
MLSQGHAGSSAGNYTLGLYDGGLVFAFETVDTKLVAPVNGLTNGWHHVAVTHRFGATQDSHWYLNGEELTGVRWTNDAGNPTDGAAPVKANSRSPYYLGFSATQHLYTAGALDEIRVWRVVRSQTDIQATMRQTLTGSEPGLVAYWNFDEPAGATAVRDLSPNGNTGQLRGGAQLRPPEAGSRPAAVVILEYPSGCSPNPVPAGLVVFQYGVGGGSRNLDEVQRAIGRDTYGAIFVNGKPVLPATSAMIDGRPLDANGRTVNPDCDGSQCGFTTFAALQLEPGTYDVSATWPRADTNPDPRSCRLTVSAP